MEPQMSSQIPTIVITDISEHWNYFQYFILALYTLKKNKKIKLKFKTDLAFRISRFLPECYASAAILSILKKIFYKKHKYNLKGFISYGKKRRFFCIDIADSPYLFSLKDLNAVDCYFKMQCPAELTNEGFYLTDAVCIPYQSHEKDFHGCRTIIPNIILQKDKIKPLMVGFRRLAFTNSYHILRKNFNNYKKSQNIAKTKKAMCYFGNAKGPKPNTNVTYVDVDQEADLMGFYTEMQHPNEKRKKLAMLLDKLGPGYDARIISEGNADSRAVKHKELIVPLEKFCEHVANFQYNINISGYRKSLPNRFVESFVVGTAIFTDKLFLKWYLPFGKEVVETVEMGYKRNDSVDWAKVEKDLSDLPNISKEDVLKEFNEKWAPEPLGDYILATLLNLFK